MKTKLKKSPQLYAVAALLLAVPVLGVGYLFVDSVSEIVEKRRLLHGVQIMATVTDRESRFSIVGGGFNTYEIDYGFQYTDRQTGQLKKETRDDYRVYQKEYATFTPGSTFVASFIPGEPTINGPAATVGRLNPQSVLLARLMTGFVFLGIAAALIWKFHGISERIQHSQKLRIVAATLFGVFIVGLMAGGGTVRLIEHLLLK